MDAHLANQIGQKTIRTPIAVAFRGPARQCGSGGLGAFAMRMGRVAIPLVKQYLMPVAKEFGKNLLSPFVPEISNVISGRKRLKTVLGETLKKSASKTIASTTSAASSKRVNARAYTSKKPIASVSEIVRPIATPRWAGRDGAGGRRAGGRVTNNGAGRHRVGSGPSSGRQSRDNKLKEVINRKKFAARSRSDILSGVAFNN